MKRLIVALALALASLNANAVLTCYVPSLGTSLTWYVGNPFYGAGADVESCTATGNELAYIRYAFTGLRMRHGNTINGKDSVTWFGDDAEFIVNNL